MKKKTTQKQKNTVKINGEEYTIKYTLRALFIFEQISKKPFAIETLLDNYILFYSMILANNADKVLSWDDFIDALDNDPNLFAEIQAVIDTSQKKNELLSDVQETEENGEKKS